MLTDEQRRTVLGMLGIARRILRSDEPLLPETRECLALLLEQFEDAVLVMDAAERKMHQLADQYRTLK